MQQLYIVLGLVFTLAVAIFAVQNATAVDVSFLGWSFENISLVLVILSSVVGGALISLLLGLPRQLRNAMKLRELTAQNQRLANEVETLSKENLSKEKQHGVEESSKDEKQVVN